MSVGRASAHFVEQALNHYIRGSNRNEEEPVQIRDGTGDDRWFRACSEYVNAGTEHAKDLPRSVIANPGSFAELVAKFDIEHAAVGSIIVFCQPDAVVFCQPGAVLLCS